MTDGSLQTGRLCSPLTQNPGTHFLPFVLWLSIDNNPIIQENVQNLKGKSQELSCAPATKRP